MRHGVEIKRQGYMAGKDHSCTISSKKKVKEFLIVDDELSRVYAMENLYKPLRPLGDWNNYTASFS